MCCNAEEPFVCISPDGSETYLTLGKITGIDFNRDGESNDVTTFDTGEVREFCPGRTTATLSLSAIRCYDDPGQTLLEYAQCPNRTEFYITWAMNRGENIPQYWSKALITSSGESKTVGGNLEVSYEIQLSGMACTLQDNPKIFHQTVDEEEDV